MTDRFVTHSTFVIEHTYSATPAKVFAAFASAEAKSHWFAGGDTQNPSPLQLDFRVGGREKCVGGPPDRPIHTYEAIYHDIVPDQRYVATYNMWEGDELISVSLATAELQPLGTGTKLVYTEHGAYLVDKEQPIHREHGTREMLIGALSAYLEHEQAGQLLKSGK